MRTGAFISRSLLALALCLAACRGSVTTRVVDDGVVIEDVTLISPERQTSLPHAVVIVRNGRIVEIGTDLVAGPHARRIVGCGRFLIPGLIDSHVHVGNMGPLDDAAISAHPELLQAYRSQLPRAFLAFGFTTLVDLDLRKPTLRWFEAAPVHPNLYHCGRGVHTAGGYGAQRIPKDTAEANAANVVHEASQAERWPATLDPRDYTPARAVDRVVEVGAVCVKTFQIGRRADLLLSRANPLETISAYDTIDTIFVNGEPIARRSLLPTN